jgi:hypothetical protein
MGIRATESKMPRPVGGYFTSPNNSSSTPVSALTNYTEVAEGLGVLSVDTPDSPMALTNGVGVRWPIISKSPYYKTGNWGDDTSNKRQHGSSDVNDPPSIDHSAQDISSGTASDWARKDIEKSNRKTRDPMFGGESDASDTGDIISMEEEERRKRSINGGGSPVVWVQNSPITLGKQQVEEKQNIYCVQVRRQVIEILKMRHMEDLLTRATPYIIAE